MNADKSRSWLDRKYGAFAGSPARPRRAIEKADPAHGQRPWGRSVAVRTCEAMQDGLGPGPAGRRWRRQFEHGAAPVSASEWVVATRHCASTIRGGAIKHSILP